MLSIERRWRIINYLKKNGTARISDLSKMLEVSDNTIRRDLDKLVQEKVVKRIHGGGVLIGDTYSPHDFYWIERETKFSEEKKRIGAKAAELIQKGETVILDVGTTTIEIAKNLSNKKNITVITNGLNIATQLIKNRKIDIILSGGTFREVSMSLVGIFTEEFFKNIHVDKLFLSAGNVNINSGVTNTNIIEVPIKRAMIEVAEEVILTVTYNKIGKRSFAYVCPISAINKIITDKKAPEAEINAIRKKGIEVIMV